MQITIKLFASFRDGRFKISGQELPEGTDCLSIVTGLGITEKEIGVILINGKHAKIDTILMDEDTLALFPLIGGG